jgi:uncharacterized repeat protein (TIGR01451 family)
MAHWHRCLNTIRNALRGYRQRPSVRFFRPQVENLERRVALSVLYNENVSGDLPGNPATPTPLTLVAGTNSIIGNVTGGSDTQDWVTLHVPSGLTLSSLILASYVSNDLQGFIGVQKGTSFVGDSFSASSYLGYAHFGTGATNGSLPPTNLVGDDLLPIMGNTTLAAGSQGFTPPLPSGDYTFLIQQFGLTTAYQLDFITTRSAPAPGDLTIGASHVGSFRRGDPGVTYTLSVSNAGNGPTTGLVHVSDTLPTGLAPTAADSGTINGWSVSTNGQTITATRSDALASGASYPALTLTVSVANDAPTSVTNTVVVSGGGETNTANDSASDPTTIVDAADLTITKSHTGSFRQGDTAYTYTLTVANVGPGPTTSLVTVTDILPAGLTPTAADTGTISGWSVSVSGQTITATRSDLLAAGGNYPPLAVVVAVAPLAAPSVTNNATVAGGGELNTANDSASDPTTIIQVADLIIASTHAGTFHAGDTSDSYTITVSNSGLGPTDASTVTVIDTLPLGLTPTSANSGVINGWTVSVGGQKVAATRNDVLDSGASYPALAITVNVAADVAPLVINTVAVAGGGELNTANDTASDPTATTSAPDLTITKSHTATFRQGDSADTYTLTVNNIGPAPTVGTITLTDTLPTGLQPTPADSGTIAGWNVSFSGQTVTASRSDALASGAGYPSLTLTVSVAGDAPASLTNTAIVAGGGELNTTNDSAQDVTTIAQAADLTISVSHAGNLTGGTTGAYTITVTNSGRGATTAPVTVIDTLPAGLTYAGPTVVNGWTISVSGRTVTATRSDALASGASYPALTLNVNAAPLAQGTVTNSVAVSGGGEVIFGNDVATDVTTILVSETIRRRRGA